MSQRHHVLLDDPLSFETFRRHARSLVEAGCAPESVAWQATDAPVGAAAPVPTAGHARASGETASLWDLPAGAPAELTTTAPVAAPPPGAASRIVVPAAYVALCRAVLLHAEPQRHALLYRLLWRLQHEPALRHDPLDPDWLRAQRMERAVRRDIHKMRAFVRFTPVDDGRHVAWFEPEHHIVAANAGFFQRRFAQMHWAILTPRRCVEWDGRALHFAPGADRSLRPAPDAGEALWLTYYQHIFNPARLNLPAMTREMPRRYWHNLPEAALISPLAAAGRRSLQMIDAAAPEPRRARRLVRSDGDIAAASSPTDDAARTTPAGVLRRLPDGGPPVATLAALQHRCNACRACPIGEHATQAVGGRGPIDAPLAFVGEQPGDQEDLAGLPFVGPAGRHLSQALTRLGIPLDAAYVTNAVKHFKYEVRGRRRIHKTAAQREAAICQDWLDEELALARPQALVALGATAARALLGRGVHIAHERGRWLHERADGRPVLVTYHPSALLRADPSSAGRLQAEWEDDLAMACAGPRRPITGATAPQA